MRAGVLPAYNLSRWWIASSSVLSMKDLNVIVLTLHRPWFGCRCWKPRGVGEVAEARIRKMDARIPHGVGEKFSWALMFTAVVAACLALADCGGWAQGTTEASVQELIQRLGDKDTDASVRSDAAQALGKIGQGAKEAAPALITALANDKDRWVRAEAAVALKDIGPGAEEVAPALITALANDKDPNVRSSAAMALGEIGPGVKEAAPALISALANDKDSSVREYAARALGEIGLGAKEAAPALISALANDKDRNVRIDVARALRLIAEAARDGERTDMIDQLAQWAQVIEANSFTPEAAKVRTTVDVLRAMQPAWYEVLFEKAGRHPGLVGLVAAYLLVALLWLALLWKSPVALWRINETLEHIPKVKLPGWLGGWKFRSPISAW
jgi:hypothetical protein